MTDKKSFTRDKQNKNNYKGNFSSKSHRYQFKWKYLTIIWTNSYHFYHIETQASLSWVFRTVFNQLMVHTPYFKFRNSRQIANPDFLWISDKYFLTRRYRWGCLGPMTTLLEHKLPWDKQSRNINHEDKALMKRDFLVFWCVVYI